MIQLGMFVKMGLQLRGQRKHLRHPGLPLNYCGIGSGIDFVEAGMFAGNQPQQAREHRLPKRRRFRLRVQFLQKV
jgi:hypothetical protein